MARNALLRDRNTEIGIGVVLFLVSGWLIYDAYEGRGVKRPFIARFLP
jgi:hypothetical protein